MLSGLHLSGLRARLLLLVLLAVVPALALILHAALEERRDEAAHAAEETRRLAGLVGAGLARTLETTGQLLLTLGQLRELEGDDPTQCRALLTRVLGLHPQYAVLAAVKPSGEVFCSTASLGRPPNVADRPHFRRALDSGRLAVGRYQVAPVSGRLVLPLAQPVVDGAGRMRAVVFAGLGLEYLGVLAGEARLPWGAELVVTDGEGGLLGRYPDPERWVGRAVVGTPLGAAVLGAAGAAQVAGLDGVARLYGLASLRATGEAGAIRVAVGLPGEAVYAQATRHLVRDLVGLAVVVLLALGVTWVASELFLLRPVLEFLRAFPAMALDQPLDPGVASAQIELAVFPPRLGILEIDVGLAPDFLGREGSRGFRDGSPSRVRQEALDELGMQRLGLAGKGDHYT